jgi:hypothetical protein
VICRLGLVWDCKQTFHRFVEDCSIRCDAVTPQMLAAPFYRGSYTALLVPTGFANSQFSRLLPALRASSPRIRRFLENGGRLIVFGAADCRTDAYNWLPFTITYHHAYQPHAVTFRDQECASILEGYDTNAIECDGYLSSEEGIVVATGEQGEALMVTATVGRGTVIVTTFHEYPSRTFMGQFCCGEREILF